MIKSLAKRGIVDEAQKIDAHNVAERALKSLWGVVNHLVYIPSTGLESLAAAAAATAKALNGKPQRLLVLPTQLINC